MPAGYMISLVPQTNIAPVHGTKVTQKFPFKRTKTIESMRALNVVTGKRRTYPVTVLHVIFEICFVHIKCMVYNKEGRLVEFY